MIEKNFRDEFEKEIRARFRIETIRIDGTRLVSYYVDRNSGTAAMGAKTIVDSIQNMWDVLHDVQEERVVSNVVFSNHPNGNFTVAVCI